VYYVARTWHVPDHVALIAGDVLHNLRSALDYLVYALIRANGKTPSTSAGFPIFDHEPVSQKEKNWFDEKIKDIPDTAQDVIRFLKPYKGGDDRLWRLHQLDIIDKHRLRFAIAPALWQFDVNRHIQAAGVIDSKGDEMQVDFSPEWISRHCPLKEGDVLFRDAPGMALDKNIKFTFHMAFTEPGLEGQPVIGVLRRCSQRVFRIVQRFGALYPG
jgi:hypothetical protein